MSLHPHELDTLRDVRAALRSADGPKVSRALYDLDGLIEAKEHEAARDAGQCDLPFACDMRPAMTDPVTDHLDRELPR